MEYLVLLPNKIVALLWYFIMMENDDQWKSI
jgi:hypothetical protein